MAAGLLRPVAATALLAAAVLLLVATPPAAAQDDSEAPAYRNHTVGGAHGWFFDAKTNSSSGNYSDWANGETFYLGDYLIFKTNDYSSVVQTTNATLYVQCDASEDESNLTSIYSTGGGGGGGGTKENVTVAVPLTVEGPNYFFSEADGGAQCQQGMRFQIKVAHGQGLPPALLHPPPAAKGRVLAPPPDGTAFSGTGTVEPGDGAGDNGGAGTGAAPEAAAGGRNLGVAVALAVAVAGLVSL